MLYLEAFILVMTPPVIITELVSESVIAHASLNLTIKKLLLFQNLPGLRNIER